MTISLEQKIKNILDQKLPSSSNKIVELRTSCFGTEYFKIMFSANDFKINNINGQFPQCVSLNLNIKEMLLEVQHFGCMGGRSVYLIPNLEDPKEKYLAMASVLIPFRKPKKEEKNVLKAIGVFAERWIDLMKENKDRLFYKNLVDYDELLK